MAVALKVAALVAASLTMVGTLCVMLIYLLLRKMNSAMASSVPVRLLFWLSVANFFAGLSHFSVVLPSSYCCSSVMICECKDIHTHTHTHTHTEREMFV